MKIGILTQPLHNNYGGLLQAYALQHFLKTLGHSPITVDFSSKRKPKLWGIKRIAINSIKKYILKHDIKFIMPLNSKNTEEFITEYIDKTTKIATLDEFALLSQYNFDAYVVGSDQVWRPSYSPGMPAFFLEFLRGDTSIKRISYAASFGIDNCDEFSPEDLIRYSALLKKFDAVGVREDSAVNLCDTHFGASSQQVLDPTLLLDKEDYDNIIQKKPSPPIVGDIMVYVLDQSDAKNKIITTASEKLGLIPHNFLADASNNIYPSVSQWLSGFSKSKFVITDSFHGVVFSIIFNKPFIVIGNESRGLTRFTSLLKTFNLENRLISSPNEVNIIDTPIDFLEVNKIKKEKKAESIDFIIRSLGNT